MKLIGKAEEAILQGDPRVSISRLDELTASSKKRKLVTDLIERQRRMALGSLYYFAKYVLDFKDLDTNPHLELCQFVQRWAPTWDTLILCPRGTFKSSITTVSFPLWLFCHNRDLRGLITSADLANTKNWMGLIKDHITRNKKFQILFGDWNDDGDNREKRRVWTQTAIELAGRTTFKAEHSLTASSMEVAKVSQHYDWSINDDLQNDTNVGSKEAIDKVEDYANLQIPILDPQKHHKDRRGPRMFVGTRWHDDDIYGRIISRERLNKKQGRPATVKILVRKAYEGKVLYFPSRFSWEYLRKIEKESGLTRQQFSCNYLNDPLPDEDKVFKKSDFGFFWYDEARHEGQCVWRGKISPISPPFATFATLDPSVGEAADSDFSALPTFKVDQYNRIFTWDLFHGRIQLDDMLLWLFTTHSQYHPTKLGVESVVFQKAIVWAFKRECQVRGTWFPITELHTDTTISKDMRIRGFQPFVSSGFFYYRVPVGTDLTQTVDDLYYLVEGNQGVLIDEMNRFPIAATKDALDATAYLPQLAFPASKPKANVEPEEGTFNDLLKRLRVGQRKKAPSFWKLSV